MTPIPMDNPFAPNPVMVYPAVLPVGHVPELHKPTLDAVHRLIHAAKQVGQPTSLLVVGEAGSGKTHLVAQLRDDLRADPGTLVVTVSLLGAYPNGIWRHIRKRLADDLLREIDGHPGGLRRLLVARYPQWGQVKAVNGIFDIIFPPSAPKLAQLTAKDSDLQYELRAVLPKVFETSTELVASEWLRGRNLPDDDLAALGLKVEDRTDQEQEVAAREVVLSLCRLASKSPALVIVFDNLESIQATTTDTKALRDYAWAAGELATEPGPRVVVTFARPS